MKTFGLAILLFLSLGVCVWFFTTRQAPPQDLEIISANPDPFSARVAGMTSRLPITAPDSSVAAMSQRFEQVLTKLESLEDSVREARSELKLLAFDRTRTSVPAYPTSTTSRLGDQDFHNLRAMIREELMNESWVARQRELALIAYNLEMQLSLETKTIDALIEILCTNGRKFFLFERELSLSNHETRLAKRRASDFRDARRRLREDIGALYEDGELAARIFLHVVSHGEVAALRLGREKLLAIEKEWLR